MLKTLDHIKVFEDGTLLVVFLDGTEIECKNGEEKNQVRTLIFLDFSLRKKKVILSLQRKSKMVDVAQLVRASDCGSEGRRFEPDLPPL